MGRKGSIRYTLAFLALGAVLYSPVGAWAQEYPTRQVTFVYPSAPGGGPDIMLRAVAQALDKLWGKPAIVVNEPGAGGAIGTAKVAKAPPDGYTVLYAPDYVITYAKYFYKDLPFDPDKDFVPVTSLYNVPLVLFAHTNFAPNTVPELITYAKKHPDELSFASNGVGSSPHLAGALLNKEAGIDIEHIPYKSLTLGTQAVIAGDVQLIWAAYTLASQFVENGQLKSLAIAGPVRLRETPSTPTFLELNYPSINFRTFFGFWLPAGTPPDIVQSLNESILKVVKTAEFEKFAGDRGYEIDGTSSTQFAIDLQADNEIRANAIAAAGVQPQ